MRTYQAKSVKKIAVEKKNQVAKYSGGSGIFKYLLSKSHIVTINIIITHGTLTVNHGMNMKSKKN